jgi:hypothetical protein
MRLPKFVLSGLTVGLMFATLSSFASVNIFVQPQNQTVAIGSNAVFTATTTTSGGETITGYTWLSSTNSSGPFNTIPGATGPSLTVSNAQFSHSGFYFVRVNYQSGPNSGLAISTAVTLSVQDQARITGQPVNLTRAAGATASFSVTAAGEGPLGFQWRFNGVNLTNGGRISGANAAGLAISALTTNDAGNYDVIVTNSYSSVTSQVAVLTILTAPVITLHPTNVTVLVGETVTLSGAASGSAPLSFRWKKGGVNVSNSGRISGATTSELVITNSLTNDSGLYSLFVSNTVGSTSSVSATVSVLAPPVFTSSTNLTGQQGAPFSFKLTATGSAPITFSSEELPNGLSLNGTSGQISGVPVVPGIFTVTVFASNAASNVTGSVTFTITTGAPGIISPLSVQAQQGQPFSYSILASNNPVSFGASELPSGLDFDPNTGVISGTPVVSGSFQITIGATNQYGVDTKELTLIIATSAPVITSSLNVSGKQGVFLSYTIRANNNPVSFNASGLPGGLNFNPANGVISGIPIESGFFFVTIGASNSYGSDNQLLLLNLITGAPIITSALTVNGVENQGNFTYTILANNSPTSFGALGLPLGLTVNTNTGVISGTPVIGATNNAVIFARNAWGTGSNVLQIKIAYAPFANLFITDVTWNYSKPFLLDFTFTLRDSLNPSGSRAIVRPIDQLQVVCKEGDTNQQIFTEIGNETAFIVSPGITSNAKQLKSFIVMDYTYSMFIVPGAFSAMESAVKGLIDQEPASAQFAVSEFNADYVTPALVIDFTSDKARLRQAIDGIQTNFVKGNFAGSRFYDALSAAVAKFGAPNPDEQRYVIVMSDGNDDASTATLSGVIGAALTAKVQIYCVGFGANVNTGLLQQISAITGGRYFAAASVDQIASQFAMLLQDLNAQYFLRWATLQRVPSFQPMFEVTVDGVTASYNPYWPVEIIDTNAVPPTTNVYKIDTSTTPPTTNLASLYAPDFVPNTFSNNVRTGELRLVSDAATNASAVTLRAFYVPRFIREIKLHYRPNYLCVPTLLSAGPGDILAGWSLTETNDGTNGLWLTISSPDPTNLLTSLPYGIRGDLVKFQFANQAVVNPRHAFSFFTIDNSIYMNSAPTGQSFVLSTNGTFVTVFAPTPPMGTPVPWLMATGFTTNFANAELTDPNGNGLLVWQEYLAGLNPNDPNSTFEIRAVVASQPGQPTQNQITFSSVLGKTYRIESSVTLGNWSSLLDGINGTGGDITVLDNRDLSTVSAMYYRIAVY